MSKAKHTFMTIYGNKFDIKSARRVGKVDVNKPRDILIDMTLTSKISSSFLSKHILFNKSILYNQAQSGISRNPILNFDNKKPENLAYEKIYINFFKMIIGVSKIY